MLTMKKDSKVYVAGHRGLVGSAIVRALKKKGYTNLILKTRKELNLLDQKAVQRFFMQERPEFVFLAAARVGGIVANRDNPGSFIYENLTVETNVIHASYLAGVKKLLFLGSSCIYPRDCPQPMREHHLLSGHLEETNKPYAVAKISGIIMCQSYNAQYGTNFISAMPTNLYGEGDNFDLTNSHVLPAILRKFHEAKVQGQPTVTLWGTGAPRREFLHSDDLADACVFLMNKYNDSEIINVGSGSELSIKRLATEVQKVTGYKGRIVWDRTKPDGTPRKLMDSGKLRKLGWKSKTSLSSGLKRTYAWYVTQNDTLRTGKR